LSSPIEFRCTRLQLDNVKIISVNYKPIAYNILTQGRKLQGTGYAVVRRQVYTSNVPHVGQIQFVKSSLIGVAHVTVLEPVAQVLWNYVTSIKPSACGCLLLKNFSHVPVPWAWTNLWPNRIVRLSVLGGLCGVFAFATRL